ncbi:hypothetical protein ATANTOWER_027864, partial [Ataeniobius toweri]|nr:hypothetical protein [Ataeniobius toweri]
NNYTRCNSINYSEPRTDNNSCNSINYSEPRTNNTSCNNINYSEPRTDNNSCNNINYSEPRTDNTSCNSINYSEPRTNNTSCNNINYYKHRNHFTSPSNDTSFNNKRACASNPCLGGSTCEERANQSFVCLCLTGDFYIESCVRGKVFPGKLSLTKKFDPNMSNKQSQGFKDTSDEIINAIDQKFSEYNFYSGSSVLELRGSKPSKTRAEEGNVEASIEIFYHPNADITEKDVKETMETITCDSCSLPGTFATQDLCDSAPCDKKTTTCKSTEGTFTCSCQEGFNATNFSDRICLECPAGETFDKNKCVPCGFGRTGTNCKDNRILILVIVAPILGALLIIALILLGVLTTKSKKKSSKIEDEDIGKPYHSHSIAKAPLSKSDSNGYPPPVKELTNGLAVSSGAPRIPRATATGNWESRTNLEMTPSNSRQNLISSGQNSRFDDNQDDMISFAHSRPKNNPYEQIRPTSNPYAQNRSMNPYAQSRGQTNPYYS